jgi:drug/metabolite transporter (DMT)-like permease
LSTTTTAVPHSGALTRGGAYGLLALVVVLWGANWPTMKVGLHYITPLWFGCIRMGLGSACLFAYLAATGKLALPTRRDLPVIVSVGLCQMAIFQPLVNFGLQHVPAGRSSVLVYTTPLWVVPGAMLFLRERLTPLKLSGLLSGLLGVAVLFNPWALDWSNGGVVAGSLALMFGAMIWGVAILHIRGHRWYLSPLQLTAWQLLLAFLLLLPLAAAIDGGAAIQWNGTLIAVILYNGPLATAFCFWASTSISRALPAITSSLSFLAVPAMGIALSTLTLGEPLTLTLLGGFGLILAGVALVNLADRRRSRQTSP